MRDKVLLILIGNIKYDGRVQKTIKTLVEKGYIVDLICSDFDDDDTQKNYNCNIHYIRRRSGGKLFIQLLRTFIFFIKCRKLIKKIKPNYIHCNDLCSTIYVLGLFSKYRIVFDSHELSLDLYDGVKRKVYAILEYYVVKNSYKIILPQIDRLNIFYFRYKKIITKDKLFLIENFPLSEDENVNSDFFYTQYGFTKPAKSVLISYTGAIQKARKLEVIIKSISRLPNVYFFIIGPADTVYLQRLKKLIQYEKLSDRVFIKRPVHNKFMLSVAASSDIGVCLYGGENINSYFCASNKIYEYLNMGVKVITNDLGGTARIINHKQNGYLIKKISEDEIVSAVEFLQSNNYVMTNPSYYFWESQENIFSSLYI